MPKKSIHIRISQRRLNKLREYAVDKDKTMTAIIEDLIDSLPEKTLPAIHEGLCAEPASAPCKPRLNANSKNMA